MWALCKWQKLNVNMNIEKKIIQLSEMSDISDANDSKFPAFY